MGMTLTPALPGLVVKRATADQSITSNTTLASATNMSFAIGASEEWVADFDLDCGDALGTATGAKFAVTVPAGATLNAIVTASAIPVDVRTTTGGGSLDIGSFPAAALTQLIRISVWVLNSTTPGTVQLQIAQSASSGTALVLRKGSHMRAYRIP